MDPPEQHTRLVNPLSGMQLGRRVIVVGVRFHNVGPVLRASGLSLLHRLDRFCLDLLRPGCL